MFPDQCSVQMQQGGSQRKTLGLMATTIRTAAQITKMVSMRTGSFGKTARIILTIRCVGRTAENMAGMAFEQVTRILSDPFYCLVQRKGTPFKELTWVTSEVRS